MKKITLFLLMATIVFTTACEKDNVQPNAPGEIPKDLPRTIVSADMTGSFMYGNFSMTEYWSQSPYSYLGNALQFAIAFKFESNGTYTHYFTSSSVSGGVTTYQQSVTKGTVEVDPVNRIIKTHPYTSHYKRTRNNQVLEERDMAKEEMSTETIYSYTTGVEPNGTRALYLTLNGTTTPLTFLLKQ